MPTNQIDSGVVTEDPAPHSPAAVASTPAEPIYTCPMHPEVQQDHPGDCPKCGMSLERKTQTAGADVDESAELHDMTRRL